MSHEKYQLVQQILRMEADLNGNLQTIKEFERCLFGYSQLANLQVGSSLITEMTERMVAERMQYEATSVHYEELLDKLGSMQRMK